MPYDITTAVAVLILIFLYFLSLMILFPSTHSDLGLSLHDCLKARALNDLYFNFILVAPFLFGLNYLSLLSFHFHLRFVFVFVSLFNPFALSVL